VENKKRVNVATTYEDAQQVNENTQEYDMHINAISNDRDDD